MNYHFEPWSTDDYPLIRAWYAARNLEPWPAEMIPVYGAFVRSDDDEQRKACGWYALDAVNGLAFLFDVVSNPRNSLAESRHYIAMLVAMLQTDARGKGAFAMMSVTEHRALAVEAEKRNLFRADPVTHRLTQLLV